eukprot:COSAG06_NODE_2463_length_6830_cov_17.476155_2_plen_82_part_00
MYDQFNGQGGAGGQLVEVSLLESGAKTSSSPPNYAMNKSADRSVNLPRQASDRSTFLTPYETLPLLLYQSGQGKASSGRTR